MNLGNLVFRPGRIVSVTDASKGLVKCSAPGLFSSYDGDLIPDASPIPLNFGTPSGAFSTPNVDEDVWVAINLNNPEQIYWVKNNDFHTKGQSSQFTTGSDSNVLEGGNAEVVMSRETGNYEFASIYYNDNDGLKACNGESNIQIKSDSINLSAADNGISINDNGISIGSLDKSTHPCPHGDDVQELFENIIKTLKKVAIVSKLNIYTKPIGLIIDECVSQYETDPASINSEIVTIE